MAHTLTLNIPDDVYQGLLKTAEEIGRTPEELAGKWVATAVQDICDDPLLKLAGTLECGISDLSERHHDYIGEGLMRKLSGGNDG
jgi:hypothetical protein